MTPQPITTSDIEGWNSFEDFHRVKNPRLMDESYFEMVLEKYDELAEAGPME